MKKFCLARRTDCRFIVLIAITLPALAGAARIAPRGLAACDAPLDGVAVFSPDGPVNPAVSIAAPSLAAALAAQPLPDSLPPPAALPRTLAAASVNPARPRRRKKAARPEKSGSTRAASELQRLGKTPQSSLGAAFDGSSLAASENVTEEYQSLWKGNSDASLRAADPPELRELRKYKILLVPGILSGAFIRLGNHPAWPGRRYFGDQIDWLEQMGLDYEVVDVQTMRSFEHNAPIVARAIATSVKPVLAVTHSWGGRILLHALISRPDLRARVRGWIPVQVPFSGSHIADFPAIGAVSNLLRLFGGSKETVLAMSTARSREYCERHREDIAEILRVVPAVAFASWVNPAAPRWLAFANPLLQWAWEAVSRRGGRNDILIPVESAVLPGLPYVAVPGVDHLAPFIETPAPFDRVRFLKTLLTMVLRRVPAR